MSKNPFILVLLYCLFLLTGRVYGIGEKILSIGPGSWELIEKKQGVILASMIRPEPVLVLDGLPVQAFSNGDGVSSPIDLYLSFDEGRPGAFEDSLSHYDLSVSPELGAVPAPWTRAGNGAALFRSSSALGLQDGPLVLKPKGNALFAPGTLVRDFSIEFWLCPQNLENGELVFVWSSSKPSNRGGYVNQRIQCAASRSRLQWSFENFFFAPGSVAWGGEDRISLVLSGPPLLPRTWSHHLIRYDADLGLLEYLVDGRLEALEYTTSSGHEGAEVYTPIIGEESRLVLGSRFTGMMDEFRIHRNYLASPALAKYPGRGGRAETRTLDLGYANSRVLRIEAYGGRSSNKPGGAAGSGKVRNEYAGNGALSFADHAEMNFFVRTSNDPYQWNDVPWIPFNPGTSLADFKGRFIQVAVDFYPSGDGDASPYLSELKIMYQAAEPPPPPTQVVALAKNGAVELSWKASPSRDVGGYMVYYGAASGEYFGDRVILGNRTSIRIEGLNNGTLYYFAVAAYDRELEPDRLTARERSGEFSREVSARPLLRPIEDD